MASWYMHDDYLYISCLGFNDLFTPLFPLDANPKYLEGAEEDGVLGPPWNGERGVVLGPFGRTYKRKTQIYMYCEAISDSSDARERRMCMYMEATSGPMWWLGLLHVWVEAFEEPSEQGG